MTGFAPAYAPTFGPTYRPAYAGYRRILGQNGNGVTPPAVKQPTVTTAEGAVGLLGLIAFMGSFATPKPYKAVLFIGGIAGMAASVFSAGQRALV